tara:strand:- start:1936 stop:2130 length:195 start_codon:yes stop_codon:yes gene_type:complete
MCTFGDTKQYKHKRTFLQVMTKPFEEIKYKDQALYDYLLELSTEITSLQIKLKSLEKQRDKFGP